MSEFYVFIFMFQSVSGGQKHFNPVLPTVVSPLRNLTFLIIIIVMPWFTSEDFFLSDTSSWHSLHVWHPGRIPRSLV